MSQFLPRKIKKNPQMRHTVVTNRDTPAPVWASTITSKFMYISHCM